MPEKFLEGCRGQLLQVSPDSGSVKCRWYLGLSLWEHWCSMTIRWSLWAMTFALAPQAGSGLHSPLDRQDDEYYPQVMRCSVLEIGQIIRCWHAGEDERAHSTNKKHKLWKKPRQTCFPGLIIRTVLPFRSWKLALETLPVSPSCATSCWYMSIQLQSSYREKGGRKCADNASFTINKTW